MSDSFSPTISYVSNSFSISIVTFEPISTVLVFFCLYIFDSISCFSSSYILFSVCMKSSHTASYSEFSLKSPRLVANLSCLDSSTLFILVK